MSITKKQLKIIIEQYLYEQDDEGAPPDEEVPEDEEVPVEEEDPLDNLKSFRLAVGDEAREVKVHFKKDSLGEKIHAFIDGVKFKNAKISDLLALAGAGLVGVEDEDTKAGLLKIVQLDDNYKGKDTKAAAEQIRNKMKGSRFPFDNISGVIDKALG